MSIVYGETPAKALFNATLRRISHTTRCTFTVIVQGKRVNMLEVQIDSNPFEERAFSFIVPRRLFVVEGIDFQGALRRWICSSFEAAGGERVLLLGNAVEVNDRWQPYETMFFAGGGFDILGEHHGSYVAVVPGD